MVEILKLSVGHIPSRSGHGRCTLKVKVEVVDLGDIQKCCSSLHKTCGTLKPLTMFVQS